MLLTYLLSKQIKSPKKTSSSDPSPPPSPSCGCAFMDNYTIFDFIWLLVAVIVTVMAVVVATRCNTGGAVVFHGVLAILFPELYLLQFMIRKFALKEKSYCSAIDSATGNGILYPLPQ